MSKYPRIDPSLDVPLIKLISEINAFEHGWTHKKPCKEYIEREYCEHLALALYRKFGKRLSWQLLFLEDKALYV